MTSFATAVISWQKQHGRHDLPWQNTTDPYAIWVSEIMLQQTRVTAVIGYYAKFMQRFPNIAVLANATQEEVLQYWSGLGYYSRARNLHHAAQKIMDDFAGVFPLQFDAILSLPGIGRSTAAAISTFAFSQSQKPLQPILDGNVKRVFARHFLIEGWPGNSKIEQKMWQIAERENPTTDAIAYTQGLMDLGAVLCTRSQPQCGHCPVKLSCKAFATSTVSKIPTPRPRKVLPEKNTTMLVLMSGGEVMLEKRPPKGIWGGLWSLPEVEDSHHLQDVLPLKKLSHTFTHFKLHIQPQLQHTSKKNLAVESRAVWLSLEDAIHAAIPAPVRRILLELQARLA
ncbi:MAG: A/G-specific adenine glycosylase [Methylophilaceae bacterium]